MTALHPTLNAAIRYGILYGAVFCVCVLSNYQPFGRYRQTRITMRALIVDAIMAALTVVGIAFLG